jgi:hypothetical protein
MFSAKASGPSGDPRPLRSTPRVYSSLLPKSEKEKVTNGQHPASEVPEEKAVEQAAQTIGDGTAEPVQ